MNFIAKILVALLLVAGAFVLGGMSRRLCISREVKVFVNGNQQLDAWAQTCPQGVIRVVIPNHYQILIEPDLTSASYPGNEFLELPGLTFSRNPRPLGVRMGDAKTDTDPEFEPGDYFIAYTEMSSHDRIRIELP